jgi:hypothetical protein
MGILDRLLGRRQPPSRPPLPPPGERSGSAGPEGAAPDPSPDERAIERYRYMLRTAPPEAIEQAHQEAFAQLTPQQRQLVLRQLGEAVPPAERVGSAEPSALARMATRAEVRQPGTLERVLGRPAGAGGYGGGGLGMGGLIAGSLLSSVAGAFIGTAIAEELFGDDSEDREAADDGDADQGGGSDHGDVGDLGAGVGDQVGGYGGQGDVVDAGYGDYGDAGFDGGYDDSGGGGDLGGDTV